MTQSCKLLKRHEIPQSLSSPLTYSSKFDKKTQRATRQQLSDGTLEVDIAAEAAEAALELDAFERRLAKVKQYKKQPKGSGGLAWSQNCSQLQEILAAERIDAASVTGTSSLGTWSQLGKLLDDLDLSHTSLGTVDAKARMFSRLTTLNMSHNLLRLLDNLPASLQCLQVYDNVISAAPLCPLPGLLHLGLGHNCLTTLAGLPQHAPSLHSLDVSFNCIAELEDILPHISPEALPSLRRLSVAGNPVALTHGTRTAIVQAAPGLQYLDDTDVTFSQRRAMRKRAAAAKAATQEAAEAAAHEAVGAAAWAADMHLQGWVPPQVLQSPSSSSTPRKGGARSTSPSKPAKGAKGASKSSKSPKGSKGEAESLPSRQVITWESAMQHPQLSAIAQAATAEVFSHAASLELEAAQGVLLGVELHAVSGLPSASSISGGETEAEVAAGSGAAGKKGGKGGSKGKAKSGKSPRRGDAEEEPPTAKEEHRMFVQVLLPGNTVLRSETSALGKDGVVAWGALPVLRKVLPATVETRDSLLFDGVQLQLWEEHVRVSPAAAPASPDAASGEGRTSSGAGGDEGAADSTAPTVEVLHSQCLARGHLSTSPLLGSTVGDQLYCGVDVQHWALELGGGSTQLKLELLPSETTAAIERAAKRQVEEDMEEEAAAAAEASGVSMSSAKGGKGGKKPSKAPLAEDDEAAAARQEEASARAAQLARTISKEVRSSACVCLGVGVSICVEGPPPSVAERPPLAAAVAARKAALDAAIAEDQPSTARSSGSKKSGARKK